MSPVGTDNSRGGLGRLAGDEMLRWSISVGEPNDVLAHSSLEPGRCEALAFNFIELAIRVEVPDVDERAALQPFSSPRHHENVIILLDSTRGLGKQRAFLIGQNQTFHVRYNSLRGI